MFSKFLLVATLAVAANANLLTSKTALKAKAVACDDPSGECGEGKDCHPKYVRARRLSLSLSLCLSLSLFSSPLWRRRLAATQRGWFLFCVIPAPLAPPPPPPSVYPCTHPRVLYSVPLPFLACA